MSTLLRLLVRAALKRGIIQLKSKSSELTAELIFRRSLRRVLASGFRWQPVSDVITEARALASLVPGRITRLDSKTPVFCCQT